MSPNPQVCMVGTLAYVLYTRSAVGGARRVHAELEHLKSALQREREHSAALESKITGLRVQARFLRMLLSLLFFR